MTTNEPPDNPDELQPPVEPEQQPPTPDAVEPVAPEPVSEPASPYASPSSAPVPPMYGDTTLELPSDRIGAYDRAHGKGTSSNLVPIIAGVVTALVVVAALAVYIFTNGDDPVAAPATTQSVTSSTDPSVTPTTNPTTSQPATSSSTAPPTSGSTPRFETASCEFSLIAEVDFECGWLIVPEDRQHPENGSLVRIHVARFHSTDPNAPSDPIVYLDGGPGGSTLEPLQFTFAQFWEPMLANRDLILFDQRGVGYSTPSLDCPEEREWSFSVLDEDLTSQEERTGDLAQIQDCRERLTSEGVDVAQYNSAENAADVADLRVALGLDQVNLLGISYGTRLAATVMRDHPEGIRSVILDSTYTPSVDLTADGPANFARALEQLWEGCAEDPGCADRYPNLEQRFFDLVAGYNQNPVTVPVQDFLNGGSWDVLVDGDWLLGTVFQGLYSEQVIPLLPRLIEELENGNTATLSLLTANTLANSEFFSLGMMLSVQCNEEVAFTTPDKIATGLVGFEQIADAFDGASNLGDFMLAACDVWQAGTADPVENEAISSNIPTLVMAGEYDPITPPEWGEDAAANLLNSEFVLFPGLGHGTSLSGECPLAIALAFFDEPGPVDTSCVSGMQPVDFEVPGEPRAALTLVPFSEDILGATISGVVPDSWSPVGFGAYARGESAIDQTAIVQQVAPFVSPEGLVELLAGQFGMATAPQESGTQASELGDWRLFQGEADGFDVDIAAVDLGGRSAFIVLVSNPAERDQLVEQLLMPAIEAFRVEG